jgi:hypothetical protein
MAAAETARLIASLELKDQFSKQLGAAEGRLGSFGKTLDHTSGRAYKAGTQIGTGIKAGVAIAVAGIGAIGSLLVLSAKEGQHAADVQNVYNKAIQNSGKITGAYVKALDAQALALSNLTGQDDELIRSEQTRLIQMGLTGQQIQKLLPLILDAAQSTGRDLDSVTLAVGRAVQGSATSLGRLGIIVPKIAKATKSAALITLEQKEALVKVEIAQAKANGTFEKSVKSALEHKKAVLDAAIAQQKYTDSTKKATGATSNFDTVLGALKPFSGVNAALSQSLDVKLKVFRERLQDIREEAGIKLLPSLVKITDVVTKSVLPAFQSFIDSILPSAIKGLEQLGDFLASGGAAKAFSSFFDTAKAAAPIFQKTAEATFTIVKAAVSLFSSLPAGIQQLAVGAFAVNKLTGGLVTNIAGGIFDAFKGLRGSTPATPMFVKEVGLPGGVPGAPAVGGLLPALGNIATKLGGLALVIGGLQGLQAGINTGGPTGAAIGSAGGAAVIGGAALLLGPLGAIAASIGVVGKTLIDIRGNSATQGQSIADAIGKQISGGATTADLQTSLAAVNQGINDIQANPLNVLVAGDALDQLRAQRDLLQRQIDQGLDSPAHIGTAVADKLLDSPLGKISPATITAGITAGLRNEFRQMIAAIKSNKPADVVAGIRKAVDQLITKAGGSVSTTKETISALRTALGNTHDPKLQATIRAALSKVEAKLPGREYAARAQRQLDGMLSDGKLSTSELKKIKGVEQALKDRGLPHAADVIGRHIDSAKRAQVAAAHNTSEAIRKKRLAVTVNNSINTHVTVNSRDVFTRQRQYSKLFATAQ